MHMPNKRRVEYAPREADTIKTEELNELEEENTDKVYLESMIKEIETKLVVGGEEMDIAEKGKT